MEGRRREAWGGDRMLSGHDGCRHPAAPTLLASPEGAGGGGATSSGGRQEWAMDDARSRVRRMPSPALHDSSVPVRCRLQPPPRSVTRRSPLGSVSRPSVPPHTAAAAAARRATLTLQAYTAHRTCICR